ncbi:MAG: substrate-binding domain-containing protein [Oscillospiraceae bacterium]
MKKTIKVLALAMCLTVATSAFAGCTKKNITGSESSKAATKKIVVGLSMNTQSNPFFVDVKDGVQKAADDNGVTLIVTDAQNNSATQVADVENLIQKKPDAIIIDPTDSDAIVSAIELCNKAGIPVITMDRQANGGVVASHIGYNAIKSGTIAGNYLVDTFKDKATVNVVEIQGIMGTNVAQERSKGFNDVISTAKNFKKVATQAAEFDRAKAMSVMENILQANPEIDCVYAANDEMGLGALEAISAAGRLDKITVISCDAIDPALDKIKSGELEATIAEPPFFLGKEGLKIALDILNKKTVEKAIFLDNKLVTKDTVGSLKTRD